MAGVYGLTPDGLARYRANRPQAGPGDVLAAIIADWLFGIPAIRVAEARAGHGTAGTWTYRFDHPDPDDNHRFGALHAAEIPYVFDNVSLDEVRPRLGDTPSQAVADHVHKVWVDFVTGGTPGWAAYDSTHRTTGLLTDTTEAVDNPAGDERATWDGIR